MKPRKTCALYFFVRAKTFCDTLYLRQGEYQEYQSCMDRFPTRDAAQAALDNAPHWAGQVASSADLTV